MKLLPALLLCIGLCTGCATAVMSGAASGDNDYPPAVAEDMRITRAVRTALYRDAQLRDERIQVSTLQGTVTLRGAVSNRLQISRALDIASDIDGVREVRVELFLKDTR